MMKNGTIAPQAALGQAALSKVIRDLEQPMIDLIAMSDILHDGLLFRTDHPTDKKSSSYDGAVYLDDEIHDRLTRLCGSIASSVAYKQPRN